MSEVGREVVTGAVARRPRLHLAWRRSASVEERPGAARRAPTSSLRGLGVGNFDSISLDSSFRTSRAFCNILIFYWLYIAVPTEATGRCITVTAPPPVSISIHPCCLFLLPPCPGLPPPWPRLSGHAGHLSSPLPSRVARSRLPAVRSVLPAWLSQRTHSRTHARSLLQVPLPRGRSSGQPRPSPSNTRPRSTR